MEIKNAPCPWCEGSNIVTCLLWQATCLDCGAEGPKSSTQSGALAAWNKRAALGVANPPPGLSLGQRIADAACQWSLLGDTEGWGSDASSSAYGDLLTLCKDADAAEAALTAAGNQRTADAASEGARGTGVCRWLYAGQGVYYAGCSGKSYGEGYWDCPDCNGKVRLA